MTKEKIINENYRCQEKNGIKVNNVCSVFQFNVCTDIAYEHATVRFL